MTRSPKLRGPAAFLIVLNDSSSESIRTIREHGKQLSAEGDLTKGIGGAPMVTALFALAVIAGISAVASGTGWHGFLFASAVMIVTGALLFSIFWVLGLLP